MVLRGAETLDAIQNGAPVSTKKPSRIAALILCALALLAVLLANPDPLLHSWRNRLQHWEELPRRADAVFILLGDVVPRATYAAMLAREGRAPLVAMGTPGTNAACELGLLPREEEIACRILNRLGIPDSAVVVLPGTVESTYDEAVAASSWAVAHGLERVLFVTSSCHASRARWILRRVCVPKGIVVHLATVPVPEVDSARWWLTEKGLITVFTETVKTAFYRLHYRSVAT